MSKKELKFKKTKNKVLIAIAIVTRELMKIKIREQKV